MVPSKQDRKGDKYYEHNKLEKKLMDFLTYPPTLFLQN